MVSIRRPFLTALLILLLSAGILAATHAKWLAAFGHVLVDAGDPVPSDMVVVLAGDGRGSRILKAAELIRLGFAPKALVSGPEGHYGLYECDLAIPFAVKHGYPAEWFIRLPLRGYSTEEEAAIVIPELRRRNVRRFLVVTSDYHTARAGRVYRRKAQGLEFRVVAARDRFFAADSWWRTREGQKIVFFEASKTLAGFLGL